MDGCGNGSVGRQKRFGDAREIPPAWDSRRHFPKDHLQVSETFSREVKRSEFHPGWRGRFRETSNGFKSDRLSLKHPKKGSGINPETHFSTRGRKSRRSEEGPPKVARWRNARNPSKDWRELFRKGASGTIIRCESEKFIHPPTLRGSFFGIQF